MTLPSRDSSSSIFNSNSSNLASNNCNLSRPALANSLKASINLVTASFPNRLDTHKTSIRCHHNNQAYRTCRILTSTGSKPAVLLQIQGYNNSKQTRFSHYNPNKQDSSPSISNRSRRVSIRCYLPRCSHSKPESTVSQDRDSVNLLSRYLQCPLCHKNSLPLRPCNLRRLDRHHLSDLGLQRHQNWYLSGREGQIWQQLVRQILPSTIHFVASTDTE